VRILVYSTPIFRHVSPTGTLGYAGLEVIAWECAKGLASRGHQVALVCPDGSDCPGCHIIATGPERVTGEDRAWDKVWKEFLTFAPDAVIDHSWLKMCLTLKSEGRYKGPILNVCHAPVNTMFGSLPKDVNFNAVCISEDQKNHFEGLFGRQARRCWNGISMEYYQPLGIPRSDRFLFLGRFSTIKGADIAIEACLKAGVGLDLVGDTSITGEPEFFNKCMAMADGKQIKVHGGCNRGNTVWWYSQAKALLHPISNRFREPYGLAPVESMACSCPCLTYRAGAMPETVKPGIGGWLAESDEEFFTLVKDFASGKIGVDRTATRESVQHFTIENMVKRYEELCFESIKKEW
jgi:glycosyltransferase involved in cell wall biosynthesis